MAKERVLEPLFKDRDSRPERETKLVLLNDFTVVNYEWLLRQ